MDAPILTIRDTAAVQEMSALVGVSKIRARVFLFFAFI